MTVTWKGNLTDHFSLSEYTIGNSKTANIPITKEAYLQALMLEELRQELDYPIYVNAFYRSPELNKKVGGIPTSNHVRGCATDIHFDFKITEQIAIIIMRLWKYICAKHGVIGEAGLYSWGLHLGQQNKEQIKLNKGKFFCWDSRSGEQINNAFEI